MLSFSYAIVKDGRIVAAEGFGWQDHDAEEPTTPDTSYLVASITKTFTAATLLQMDGYGIIDLERFLSVLIRLTPGAEVEPVAAALRRRVLAVDSALPAYDMLTMDQLMWNEEARARVSTLLAAGYAVLALVLAVLGVYGVLAHAVRQERKDIGIRMALGATGAAIVRAVMGRGLRLVAAGTAAGVIIAIVASQLLGSALFGVEPRDPLVFGLALTAIVVPAVTACLVPAWRATRVDPIEALRQ